MVWLAFYSAFRDGGATPLFRSDREVPGLRDVVRELGDDERRSLTHRSRIRHANYHTFAEVLAVLACRASRSDLPLNDDQVGVIATGGPLHTSTAWDYVHTAQRKGIRLLNPMYFPHVLQSSVCCTVAAECGARAFAMTVGHGPTAFHECLAAGISLINARFAKAILLPSVNDGGSRNRTVHQHTGRPGTPADVALCCVLSSIPLDVCDVRIELSGCVRRRESARADILGLREASRDAPPVTPGADGAAVSSSLPRSTWLERIDAYAATGTVTAVEAISRLLRSGFASHAHLSLPAEEASSWVASVHVSQPSVEVRSERCLDNTP